MPEVLYLISKYLKYFKVNQLLQKEMPGEAGRRTMDAIYGAVSMQM